MSFSFYAEMRIGFWSSIKKNLCSISLLHWLNMFFIVVITLTDIFRRFHKIFWISELFCHLFTQSLFMNSSECFVCLFGFYSLRSSVFFGCWATTSPGGAIRFGYGHATPPGGGTGNGCGCVEIALLYYTESENSKRIQRNIFPLHEKFKRWNFNIFIYIL